MLHLGHETIPPEQDRAKLGYQCKGMFSLVLQERGKRGIGLIAKSAARDYSAVVRTHHKGHA